MRAKPQLLLDDSFKYSPEHGGEIRRGKRKIARPIHTKKAMHVTLRSSLAVGRYSFRLRHHRTFIENLVATTAKRWGIRIYTQSINGNHLHFNLRGETRRGVQNFMRVVAAQTAAFVTGARKGKPFGKFWDLPVYSRIAEWGKAYVHLKNYVVQNVMETLGVIPYTPRKKRPRRRTSLKVPSRPPNGT